MRSSSLGAADLRNVTPPDTATWARALGVSQEAVALYRASDVIDLHLDSFIWQRILGYRLVERHGPGLLGRRFYSHTDFPRAIEAGLTGATWVISTNPFRSARGRRDAFVRNLAAMKATIAETGGRVVHVRNAAEYREARALGRHAAFIGIQGGNALDVELDALDVLARGDVLRVTLVHLTRSRLGPTSAPSIGSGGRLSAFGRAYVERLDAMRVLVDLAHIGRRAFFDAVDAHDPSLPLIVTHTGIDAVHPHWRNLTDPQVRAIAASGGTIGIMLQSDFLAPGRCEIAHVLAHVDHVIEVVGEDHVSLGSDFDGMIVPPASLATPFDYPRLVQAMASRGYGEDRIRKILGGNALRVIAAIRG